MVLPTTAHSSDKSTLLPIEPIKINSGQASAENCDRIKELGFAITKHVKMYGEDFELVSEPYVDGKFTAVRVTSLKNPVVRVMRLPVAIIVGPRERFRHHAEVIAQDLQ